MSDLPDFQKLRHNPKHHLGLGDVRITVAQQEAIEQRIAELEAELTTSRKEWNSLLEKVEARLDAVLPAIKAHVADLRKTADTLEAWQDPMVGPFDATIAEIRKAADELEALEARDEDK